MQTGLVLIHLTAAMVAAASALLPQPSLLAAAVQGPIPVTVIIIHDSFEQSFVEFRVRTVIS
jgi:hypothetical protein